MGSDKLDERLKQIAATAQHSSEGSRERLKSISRLLMEVERSGALYCGGKNNYPIEVYHEALQELRLYIFRRIDAYDPSRAKMLTWLNRKLDFAFKDAIARHLKRQQQPLPEALSADGWHHQALRGDPSGPLLSVQVRQIIEEDPDDVFKHRHVRGRPEVNFRAIALKTCSGYSRREIAAEWGLQEQTLYSFFTRSCKTLKPLFDKYLRE